MDILRRGAENWNLSFLETKSFHLGKKIKKEEN